MDNFKSRDPIDSVHNISKNENIEKLRKLLNELAELGWNWNQWSSMLPDYDDEVLLEVEPNFNEFSSKEKSHFIRKNIEKIPIYYFIETFGHPEYGYLRAEGKSLVECAEKLIKQGNKQLNCLHIWAYTHSNGNKTCKECGTFVSCTVDEAISNYPKGSVKVNEELTLYFHNSRPICTCGSNKVYYLQHSMFNEKQYQCTVCNKYWPIRFKKVGQLKYTSLPISPNDDEYENASEECRDTMLNRHRFISLGVMSESHLNSHIKRYVTDMLKHYHYVEKGGAIEQFISWVKPFVYKAVVDTETQIKVNDKKYQLLGIKNLNIKIDKSENEININYELEIKEPKTENEDPEMVLKGVFDAILNSEE